MQRTNTRIIKRLARSTSPKAVARAKNASRISTRNDIDNAARKEILPPRVAVPKLSLADSPLYLDGGDRQISVLSVVNDPNIAVLGNVLSAYECNVLIALAKPRMSRSEVIEAQTGDNVISSERTSNGMFFTCEENDVVVTIERRLAKLVNWPLENGEGLQILQYGVGAEFIPHHDYVEPDEAGAPAFLERGGNRVATIIMYLSEPEKGGNTIFPDIQFEVAPKRGNAVFFSYDIPHPSGKTLHWGSPVIAGEKWIATKWLRERKFER
jgi:prolyl 4-hydroxylase